MATNDGVQAKHLHLTAKIKEKTQTQTLSVNKAQSSDVSNNHNNKILFFRVLTFKVILFLFDR